jgi:hypothetical protein
VELGSNGAVCPPESAAGRGLAALDGPPHPDRVGRDHPGKGAAQGVGQLGGIGRPVDPDRDRDQQWSVTGGGQGALGGQRPWQVSPDRQHPHRSCLQHRRGHRSRQQPPRIDHHQVQPLDAADGSQQGVHGVAVQQPGRIRASQASKQPHPPAHLHDFCEHGRWPRRDARRPQERRHSSPHVGDRQVGGHVPTSWVQIHQQHRVAGRRPRPGQSDGQGGRPRAALAAGHRHQPHG